MSGVGSVITNSQCQLELTSPGKFISHCRFQGKDFLTLRFQVETIPLGCRFSANKAEFLQALSRGGG
jgi:hypothetical protein